MIKINNGKNPKKIIELPERAIDRQFVEACVLGSSVFLLTVVFALTMFNLLVITDLESYLGSSLLTGVVTIGNQIFICVVALLIYKRITSLFSRRSRRREQFWGKAYQHFENKRAKNKSRFFRRLLAEKRTERDEQLLNKNFPNQEVVNDQPIHSKAFRLKQSSGYLLNYDSPDERTESRQH